LYQVNEQGKGTAVHDFDANELRDIEVAEDGTIYVAVNKFSLRTSGLPRFEEKPTSETGTPIKTPSESNAQSVRPQELRPGAKSGKGALFRLEPQGSIEQVLSLESGYFTDLARDAEGVIWAGEGTEGKVFLIERDRTVITAFDLAERQVLSLSLAGSSHYIGTGDAGALYFIERGSGPKPSYLSEIFDAKFPAQWGHLYYQAAGRLLIESRSGNTAKPDKTWDEWKRLKETTVGMGGKLVSPSARYLQLRTTLRPPAGNALRSISLYYHPLNQRAQVTDILFGEGGEEREKMGRPNIKIAWKVENPDNDPLVFRLYQREETGLNWRLISGPQPLEKSEFEWDTEPVADGYYRIKVEASDEQANAPEATLKSSQISAQLLVDNRQPEVSTLAVRYPWVSGLARDSYSPIKRIEYSLNGKPWRLIAPVDEIYDSPSEAFRFRLPEDLAKGTHVIAVRALDEADNMGVIQHHFDKN
jgi:hypothetical protein